MSFSYYKHSKNNSYIQTCYVYKITKKKIEFCFYPLYFYIFNYFFLFDHFKKKVTLLWALNVIFPVTSLPSFTCGELGQAL